MGLTDHVVGAAALWESIAVLDRVLDEIGDLEVGGRVGMLSVYNSALLAAARATGDAGRRLRWMTSPSPLPRAGRSLRGFAGAQRYEIVGS